MSQYQNLYTTSPAPTASQSNMPRMYTHQSMPRFDKSLDFSVADKKQQQPLVTNISQPLIDWINSFNDPYCLLVNSFGDLTDGIALCHLVGLIVCSPSDQEKIKQLVYYEALSKELALQNLDLAVNVLKSSNMPVPQDVQKMEAQDIQDPQNMRRMVEVLKQIHEIVSFNQKSQKPPTKSKSPSNVQDGAINANEVQFNAAESRGHLENANIQTQATMLITPRGNEKSISNGGTGNGRQGSNSHQNPMIISQSTSRGGVRGGFGSSTDRQMESASYQHQHLLSYQSDAKSAKENMAPTPPFQVMPFPTSHQLQIIQNMSQQLNTQPIDFYQDHYRNFDKSFETNNISPIMNQQPRKISPIPDPSNTKQPLQIPRVNIQAAIQQSQEDLIDMQELQIVHELSELNLSYQNMTKNQTPNNASRTIKQQSASRHSSSGHTSKRKKTGSQEQRERLRQRQQEVSDYGQVLKNTQNVIMRSKISDSDVNFHLVESQRDKTPKLEAPQSFMQESHHNENNINASNVQRSIRFKETFQEPKTQRLENNSKKTIDDDDIMSEMQTLQVQPETIENKRKELMFAQIRIDSVDIKTKQRVLEWLGNEIKLLKVNQRLIEDLPLYCKNGVFLCDLANRISSRSNQIKGVDRNPKNVTHILNNFNRVLDYLRSFPRFCPRYLWAHRYLMDGHTDVVWGLLDDIWHWHHNKISPFDPSHERNLNPYQDSRSPTTGVVSPKSQSQDPKHKFVPSKSKLPPKASNLPLQIKKIDQSRNEHVNVSQSFNIKSQHTMGTPMKCGDNFQSLERERSYSNLHQKTPQKSNGGVDMPLQIQNSQQKIKQNSSTSQLIGQSNIQNNGRALNSSRETNHQRNNSGKAKRMDVSAFGSPIARDQAGNLYFLKQSDEIYQSQFSQQNLFDERNANSLFSTKNQALSNHLYIEITYEIEGEIRKWLFDLKFGHYLSKEFEYRDICNDPFSNGLLLAELFSYLEKITLLKLIPFPRTIGESRENLQKVLSIIKQRKREFPLKLLTDQNIELILKRDKQAIYSILYHLKMAYPDSGKISSQSQPNHLLSLQVYPNSQAQQNLSLPYTLGELKLLEISLLNWLKKLGILSKLYGSLEIDSFLLIQRELTNGLLLADLIQTLFNVKIPGIFKDPKVEATCISNIRKPLEILRRQSRMSQKFTWAEREIYEGRMNVVIGLLEDLHRCFDGMPLRKRGLNYFADGPYLGDTLYNEFQKTEVPKEQVKKEVVAGNVTRQSQVMNKMQETLQTIKTAPDQMKIEVLTEQNNQYQEIPSIFGMKMKVQSLSPKSNSKTRQEQSRVEVGQKSANFSQFLNMKLQKEFKQNFSPITSKGLVGKLDFLKPSITIDEKIERGSVKKHNFNFPQQQQDILASQKKDLTSQYPVAPTRSPLNVNNRCQQQSFEFDVVRSNIKKPPHQISIAEYENEEHNMNRFAYHMQEKKKIQEWIRSLPLNLPLGFNMEVEPIIFFKDGILLSELIGHLEGTKIENIQMNPKSQASCLQNLKKALQILKKKNQVPLYLLYSEEEIFNGNPEIILELLKSIRAAYKNKVRISTTSLSNSQGRRKILGWTAGMSQE